MPITPEDFSEADLAAWLLAGGSPFAVDIADGTITPDPPDYADANSALAQGAWPLLKALQQNVNDGRVLRDVLYEVNYSTLANNTLVDGAETIDGLGYVAANMAELGTAAVQNATGIRMICATSNGGATAFDSTSQVAPYIYVPLSQIAGYDPTADYIIEMYIPSLVLETNGDNIFLGLWGLAGAPYAASVARARLAKIHNSAGTRVLRSIVNTSATDGDVAIPTHNVLAIRVTPQGLGQVYSGVWSGNWPTLVAGPMLPTAAAAASPLNTGDVRIVIGMGVANDASPTTAATIERLRIRRL
jgi:hypothetical protein